MDISIDINRAKGEEAEAFVTDQIADLFRHMPAGPGIGRHHRASPEDNLVANSPVGDFGTTSRFYNFRRP